MEVLQLLASALGISAMAGINLYLSVFATSLALNMGWLHISPQMQSLQVLGDPSIMMIAGFLYFLEFFVDKIPGLDSLWDAVHTAIRPLGAMLMSLALLGQTDVTLEIITALLCGGVALSTHATKMGIRAIINTSPEPFSNIAASVSEDVMVAGGLALSFYHPIAAAVCVIIFLAAFAWFAPKLFRFARMVLVFAFRKISSAQEKIGANGLPLDIEPKQREKLGEYLQRGQGVEWCFKGFTGKTREFPSGLICYLFKTEKEEDRDKGTENSEKQSLLGCWIKGKKLKWLDPATLEIAVKRRFLFSEFSFVDKNTHDSTVMRLNPRDGQKLEELLKLKQPT